MTTLGVLTASNSTNIGDEIQSAAVYQHFKQNDIIYIDRDYMDEYAGKKCAVVMNGWFSHRPQGFPPSSRITPIFFGFHMTEETSVIYEKKINYFKHHEPIGCRDSWTMNKMREWGVDAYVSGCATMTFPLRDDSIQAEKIIAVDVEKNNILKKEKPSIVFMSHELNAPCYLPKTRFEMAIQILEYYKKNAKNIITSRIHCAIPCLAMGIPTAYVGKIDERTNIIKSIGINSYVFPGWKRTSLNEIEYNYSNYEILKSKIKNDLINRVSNMGISVIKNQKE